MRSLTLSFILCLAVSTSWHCTEVTGPHRIGMPAGGGTPPELNDWSRVTRLDRLSRITVVLRDGQSFPREFVAADDTELAVLDLSDEALPREVVRALRSLASSGGTRFLTLSRGDALTAGNVRVEAAGVFLEGRRVADLISVFASFPRNSVLVVTGPVVARGSIGGVMAGGFFGYLLGAGLAEGGAGDAAFMGSIALGVFIGSRSGSHHVEGIVYRAR